MTISIRLNEEDTKLIKDYAKINKISISELFRKTVIEKIEDENDLTAYNKAYAAFKKNSKTYTLDEVEKKMEI